MQQRRDRGRGLHHLDQPTVGGKLRGLQDRCPREADRRQVRCAEPPRHGERIGRLGEDGGQIAGAELPPEEHDRSDQERIADPGGDELLAGGDHRPVLGPCRTGAGRAARRLVATRTREQQHDGVARQHQHLHRCDRRRQPPEELPVSGVAVQVGVGVAHDDHRQQRHHGEHDRAQGVQSDRQPEPVPAERRTLHGAADRDRQAGADGDHDTEPAGQGTCSLDRDGVPPRLATGDQPHHQRGQRSSEDELGEG